MSNEIPSMNSIYDSTYFKRSQNDIMKKSNTMYNAAQNPMKTGIVPNPAYASQFQTLDSNQISGNSSASDIGQFQSLTGEMVTNKDLKHNNMQPFLRGNVTQNTDFNSQSTLLEKYTGADHNIRIKKTEKECMFKPTRDMSNVNGMQNHDAFLKSRIAPPISKRNEFPICPVRVGPGINQGFGSKGTGGFQQFDTRQFELPVDLQKNKAKTNQTSRTFEIPIQGPSKKIDQRGVIGEMFQNKPETTFENTEDNWFRTTGAVIKEKDRNTNITVKPTTRTQGQIEYSGNAAIGGGAKIGAGVGDDYQRSSIIVYDNERQLTETKTVVSNLTTNVKAVIAPLTDVLKNGIKEYLIDASRPYGNMQAQIPEKATTYDPVSHMLKTTIKETTIHDTNKSNLKGAERIQYYSEDKAKTTTKETTPVYDTVRNISAHTYKVTVYNPTAVAKTTNKQTTIKGKSEFGFLGGLLETLFGGYLVSNPEAKNTQKQFINDNDYIGGGEARIKYQTSREAENNAEIDGTREMLNMSMGRTPNAGGGYTNINKDGVNMSVSRNEEMIASARNTGNIGKVYQTMLDPDSCTTTKEHQYLNSNENRLDPKMLSSLTNNPYNLSVNPIGQTCKV
jgi:hypothetical protein